MVHESLSKLKLEEKAEISGHTHFNATVITNTHLFMALFLVSHLPSFSSMHHLPTTHHIHNLGLSRHTATLERKNEWDRRGGGVGGWGLRE